MVGIAKVFLAARFFRARHYRNRAASPFLQEAKYCQMGLRCGKLRFPLRELLLKCRCLVFVIPSLSRDLYANTVNILIEILRLRGYAAPLRMTGERLLRDSAQGDTKRQPPFFHNQIARPKTTLFGKRTQFVAYLRLSRKGVNARHQIIFCKSKNHTFCFCTLRFMESVTEEGEFRALL